MKRSATPSRLLKKQMTAALLFSTRPVGRSTELIDVRLADRQPRRICIGFSAPIAGRSCRVRREVSDPNQVVRGQRKRKHPVDTAGAPVPRLAHEPDRLQPAENLLHALAPLLAHRVARMAGGAAVDG